MKIYIIDGNAYIYRFFHALKGLSNSQGTPTNAIYGFGSMLFKLLFEIKANAIVVVFDSKEPTDRHTYYPLYKANRPPMPDALIVQVPVIKDLISSLAIKTVQIPGVEADDIIGTMACRFAGLDHEVVIMSADKDFLQLINERVSLYDFQKDTLMDLKYVINKYGIDPPKIADVMALTGDSIDNIPGVKGIGEKKALEFIKEFSNIDNLIARRETIGNERIRKLISENIENIRLSKRLSVINCSVPLDINIDEIKVGQPDTGQLKSLINEYELKSFIKYLPAEDMTSGDFYIMKGSKDLMSYLLGEKD